MDKYLKTRLIFACAALTGGLSLLSARLVYVQVVEHERYSEVAEERYVHKETLEPSRGRILDRNGELLARNQTVYKLVVDCFKVRDPGVACSALAKEESMALGKAVSPRVIKRRFEGPIGFSDADQEGNSKLSEAYLARINEVLAPVLRMPKHELIRLLKSKSRGEITLTKNIEDDFYRELKQVLSDNRLGGLRLDKGERRYYPSPLNLTHVIGYVDHEGEGKEGVEKVFNETMTGVPGYRYTERDRSWHEIHAFRGEEKLPVSGDNVRLTIDMGLQVLVEEKLNEVVEKYAPEKVTAIFMDPRNGEVLAMASRPHFDLETRKGNLRNIAISDTYEPGSTFKMVAFGAAFDKRLITPTTPIFCHWGSYNQEGFTLLDHHPYGDLTAEMVLAKSSNIGSYMVARPLNRHLFHHYIGEFGFGKETGIELTAESSGAHTDVSEWSQTSFSSKSIGYEMAVTPIQMVSALGIIANGGGYQTPTILKAIEKPDGTPLPKPERGAQRRVISKHAADCVRRAMKKTMLEGGTGTRGCVPGYVVAGKTGTARKHVQGVGYVKGRYVVSFLGFLPADNPQLMGIVVVDDPHATGVKLYGGTIAAPIFSEMAQEAVKLLGIAPDDPVELTQHLMQSEPVGLIEGQESLAEGIVH